MTSQTSYSGKKSNQQHLRIRGGVDYKNSHGTQLLTGLGLRHTKSSFLDVYQPSPILKLLSNPDKISNNPTRSASPEFNLSRGSGSVQTLTIEPEDEPSQITFYQGFKASHPHLTTQVVKRTSCESKISIANSETTPSVVKNIQRIFEDFLIQRDELYIKKQEINEQVVRIKNDLRVGNN